MKRVTYDPSKGSHFEGVAGIGTHVSSSNEKGGGSGTVSVRGIGAGIGGGFHSEEKSHYVRRLQCPNCGRLLPQ
jgi:hypothetical protein